MHEQSIRFKLAVDANVSDIKPVSLEVIRSEFDLLPASVDLAKHNEEYLSRNQVSVEATVAGLTVRRLLKPEEKGAVEKDVVKVLDLPSVTITQAEVILELLQSWRSGEVGVFRERATGKWSNATAFSKD